MNMTPELTKAAILGVPLAVTLGVAAAARRRIGWARGLVLGLVGVTVPLVIFLLSCLLKPDAKSQCPHGWIDCLQATKLALLPLVAWALVAVFQLQTRGQRPDRRAADAAGLVAGLLVSGGSTLHALFAVPEARGELGWFLLVPIGVYIWLATWWWRLFDADRRTTLRGSTAGAAASAPFAALSAWWATQVFAGLPEHPPECFMVTAASRGHTWITGRKHLLQRPSGPREASRQLAVFWRLEERWHARAPDAHDRFRRIYNRIGPVVARRIDRPWKADLVVLALLPLEAVAFLILAAASTVDRVRTGGTRVKAGLWMAAR